MAVLYQWKLAKERCLPSLRRYQKGQYTRDRVRRAYESHHIDRYTSSAVPFVFFRLCAFVRNPESVFIPLSNECPWTVETLFIWNSLFLSFVEVYHGVLGYGCADMLIFAMHLLKISGLRVQDRWDEDVDIFRYIFFRKKDFKIYGNFFFFFSGF